MFARKACISGWIVEGRVYYDAFVLNNKKKAIAISNVSESNGTENSEPSEVTDFSSMTVEQLKEYAEANGIELNGATTKDAIIAVIEAHEATYWELKLHLNAVTALAYCRSDSKLKLFQ